MINDSEIYIAYFMRLDRLTREIEQERAPGEVIVFWLPPISMIEKHPEPKRSIPVPQSAALVPQDCEADGKEDEILPESVVEAPPADRVIVYGGYPDLAAFAAEFHASGVAANGAYSLNVWDVNALEYKRDPEMRDVYAAIQLMKEIREEMQTVVMDPK